MEYRTHANRVQHTLAAEEDADRQAGSMLRRLRLANRLAVDQAAMRAGVIQEEWEDHESGLMPIPITRIRVIALALEVEPAELLRLLTATGSISPCSSLPPRWPRF